MSIFRGLIVLGVIWVGAVGLAGEVVLAFTAEWCGPCKQFKSDVAENPELVAGYDLDIVDVDQAKEMTKDFGVKLYPTFFVVKVEEDGALKVANIVKKQEGYDGAKKFKKWLER